MPPTEIRFTLHENDYVVGMPATYVNPEKLRSARGLFAVQKNRINAKQLSFANNLLKIHKKPGEFIFRFP